MRMWNVDPACMCRQHLLGEHLEMHMFVGHIRKKRSLGRYASDKLVDTRLLQSRHDALASEMLRRGYNHVSPLDYVDALRQGHVNVAASVAELRRRCNVCNP